MSIRSTPPPRPFLLIPLLVALVAASRQDDPNTPGGGPAAPGRVSVEKTTYKGWTDSYRISNGTLEVVVVPAIGRVMHYGRVGGANLLWENPELAGKPASSGQVWVNFGGDKVWPWPQDDWPKRAGRGWPPPVAADQAADAAEVIGNGSALRLTSPVIERFGVRIVRELKLDPLGSRLTIDSRLENAEKPADFPVAPWTVTQFPPPDQLYARLLDDSSLPEGFKPMSDKKLEKVRRLGKDVIVVEPQPVAAKLGFDADVLAWRKGADLVILRASFPDSNGASRSPKPGERGQMWNNTDPKYIELEFTAPLAVPAKEKVPALRVEWQWQRIPADATPEVVADHLRLAR